MYLITAANDTMVVKGVHLLLDLHMGIDPLQREEAANAILGEKKRE
jgi:hypothetical protein